MKNFKKLSREEMRKISGALIAAPNCKSGTKCSVRSLNSFNELVSVETGFCKMSQSGSSVTCYCDAGGTTNINAGGLSHCWA
ncbi:hypothetical protein [Flavobacterium sp.]|uniref:bacteriocin-like protein n=1 Tax=Flavobacterium sp. TaxID=239 RepID=UPI00261ECE78|nr:hypothetical protein [Flavobacterium sp.]